MFAVLHIADFPLHAVLRTEPASASRPAALFANATKKSTVLAANSLARAAGVELGMTAPQALARCSTLLVRTPHAAAETEARSALLAVGFTVSPKIEDTAPGICTIDLTGLDPARFSNAAQTAVATLAAQGLPATAGLAATPLLALYAARTALPPPPSDHPAPPPHSRSPSLAPPSAPSTLEQPNEGGDRERVGERERTTAASTATPRNAAPRPTGSAPFDIRHSSLVIPPSPSPSVLHVTDPSSFLAPLPLAAADPSPELAAILHTWGLRTFGDLTALPRDEIVRRFGAAGLALWQRATGGEPRPLHPVALPQTFAAEMEFEQEIETLEPLLFILRRFLDRLTLELRASQHVAAEQHLTLRLEDETQRARSFRLPEPTADPEILFRALHTHLESLQTDAAIAAVSLRLTPARPLVRQQGLFDTSLRDPHGFAETLARVSALVGADHVGTPQLQPTHRPDAVTLTPPLPVIPPPAGPPLHPPLGAPLRRFRPPLPARLEFAAGQPTYLWTEQIRGEISARSAPYPSSGDWWQPDRAWQRIEWDIALAEGGLYRLLLIGESYFLEGEYD